MTTHPHFFRTRGDAGHPTGRPHLVHRRHDDGPDPYLEINHGPDCGQTELLDGHPEPDCDIAWQLHHGGPLEDQLPYSGDPLPTADTFWVEGWHRTIDLGPAGTEHDAGIRLTHPPQSHG